MCIFIFKILKFGTLICNTGHCFGVKKETEDRETEQKQQQSTGDSNNTE